MKKIALWAMLNMAALTNASAADLKFLGELGRSLNALANVGQAQAVPMFSQNNMSADVMDSFKNQLQPTASDNVINANWEAVIPLASRVVGLAACGVGPHSNNAGQNEIEAWKSLGRWIDPDAKSALVYGSFPLAVWHTQYHSKSSCMSILRTDRWAKPSKNTLAFRVQFVSGGSDETVNINYLFKVLDDGTWVLTRAYM